MCILFKDLDFLLLSDKSNFKKEKIVKASNLFMTAKCLNLVFMKGF